MKQYVLAVMALVTMAGNAAAQQPFTIKGSLKKFNKEAKVYVSYRVGEDFRRDSAEIKKGMFTISGQLDEPGMVSLIIRTKEKAAPGTRPDMLQLFIEPGTVTVSGTDSLKTAMVKGSATHDAFKSMEAALRPANNKMEALYNEYDVAYKAKDDAAMKTVEEKIDALQAGEMAEAYKNFILQNTASPVALQALDRMAGYDIDVNKTEPVWNMLAASLRAGKSGQAFAEKLEIARKTQIGKPAMDFTQNNAEGQPVKLSDFKGKYVLVDFWASWCGPCRKENPNVVKAFQKYKDKNFTVLGVSLDRAKEPWLKAIKDDNLDWGQVSDLKFWNNEVAALYGIKAIPQNILVGPDGTIVGKNLREDKLNTELAKLLGE